MSKQNEADIRKKLVKRLDLIEPDLELVKSPYRVENTEGAGGEIDILARGSDQMLVPIELKKSDHSSREAIQEIHKYIALLKSTEKVASEELRAIIVSTEWHELRTPFFEFKKSVNYHVAGLQLFLDENGDPVRCEPVTEVTEPTQYELVAFNHMYFFETEQLRDKTAAMFAEHLNAEGINEFIILKFFISGFSSPNPFAFLPAVMKLSDEERAAYLNERKLPAYRGKDLEDDTSSTAHGKLQRPWSELEYNSHHRFSTNCKYWTIETVERFGPRSSSVIRPDEWFITELAGVHGENPVEFFGVSRPNRKAHWKSFCERSTEFLSFMPSWRESLSAYQTELEAKEPDSSLSLHIHATRSILRNVFYFLKSGDTEALPVIEGLVDGSDGLINVNGIVVWDRETYPKDAKERLKDWFGGNFVMYEMVGAATPLREEEILNWLGLRYVLLEHKYHEDEKDCETVEIVPTGHSVKRIKFDTYNFYKSIDAFVVENMVTLQEIYGTFKFFG